MDVLLSNGYLKLSSCFTINQALPWTVDLWDRLAMSPENTMTWTAECTRLQPRRHQWCAHFAPKACAAISHLLGGREQLGDGVMWHDGFVVNLGTVLGAGRKMEAVKSHGWHIVEDGYVKFHDWPEPALLATPLFPDTAPGGGGTDIRRSILKA